MPIIRYPAGDLAAWVEDEGASNRKFKLQGRSEEAARLGTLSVYFEDTRDMVMKTLGDCKGIQFQMVLYHFNHKDELTIKISSPDLAQKNNVKQCILDTFVTEKAGYSDLLAKGLIHPLRIDIVKPDELESNVRTGKLKRIIDRRIK